MFPRFPVIFSIFKRNLSSYFSGVLGYLFIVVFVVAGGALAFNARFFTANEPTLDQLTMWYPVLLLFFVPAITMSVWAEERKMGTDELLFTLPATDIEILLGKYLAVFAVYTVALVFSMTHVAVLMWLGNPDVGLIATTYFGYWIAGGALLSAGMFASLLTNNMTVAFVFGILICSVPVFIGEVGAFIGLGDVLQPFSLNEQFRDFGMGIIPLSGICYFIGFTVLMLYLNLVLMTKRHWSATKQTNMGVQYAVRAVCVGVVLTCVTAWAGYSAFRADTTAERLFSLSPATNKVLKDLDSERPIEIQAFLSPEVPREYVDTRKRLVGLLRQFDKLGGKNVIVRYVDVEPYSGEAEEADKFGIESVRVLSERDGGRTEVEVYLGAVVISSYDKVVVPFFGKGLPIEYELTRSVQTVANEGRLTVGVLQTDAQIMGQREWQIVQELKKQYDVESVSPSSEIAEDKFDVLLAVMPSSLIDAEMDNFVKYVKTGKPVLIFDDPFPLTFSGQFGVTNAPKQPKPSPGGGMMGMMGRQPPPPPKADGGRATRLLEALGLDWEYDQVAFDFNKPHSEFEMLPEEYVFVTRAAEEGESFSSDSPVTSGLQELIMLYSGTVDERRGAKVEYTPLLTTSTKSGIHEWSDFVDEGGMNFMSMQPSANPKQNPNRFIDDDSHALAAHVKSDKDGAEVNAIFVSDVDMISDWFFQERSLGNLGISFDNVSFVLNAVDTLAGEEAFIELRSRRPQHRTLKRVEEGKRAFIEDANAQQKDADEKADKELEERTDKLKERVKEIQENENLDPIAKSQMIRQAQDAEQQQLDLAKAQIEQEKNRQLRKINNSTQRQTREYESRWRAAAVWIPPILPLCVGIVVFMIQMMSEKQKVVPARRRK